MKPRAGLFRARLWIIVATLAMAIVSNISPDITSSVGAETLAAKSHCGKTERVIFSCPLRRSSKVLSLCSSAKLTKTEGYIQYRFGKPGRVELEYPKQRARSQDAFSYNHYFRAQVDLTEISFSVDGYSYTVFDSYNGEEKPAISEAGVTVTPPAGARDITYSCNTKAQADFANLAEVLKSGSEP